MADALVGLGHAGWPVGLYRLGDHRPGDRPPPGRPAVSWQDRPPARPLVVDGDNWLLPWLVPHFGWPWYKCIANDNPPPAVVNKRTWCPVIGPRPD